LNFQHSDKLSERFLFFCNILGPRFDDLPKILFPVVVAAMFKGGEGLLTTILLPWEVPNRHIFEIITSTVKLPCPVCSMGKVSKTFKSQPYLAGQVN